MATPIDVPYYGQTLDIRPVKGNTPWGFYDDDALFQKDAVKFVTFAYRKLGGGVLDVELQDLHYFLAYEDAVNVYGKELYEYKIRENYLSLEGSPTGSSSQTLNNTLIQPNLGTVIRLAKDYGSEIGSGGNIPYYTGSIDLTIGQQMYDLNQWAKDNAVVEDGDQIEIKRVLYQAPPAITRFFDPTAATGFGYQNLLDSFGFGSMSPAVNYMMMPVYADVLRIQGIEFNDEIRRSAFSFELIDNQLRIFPIPSFTRTILFYYIKESDRNSASRLVGGLVPKDRVTNISNVNYSPITYSQTNFPAREWIFSYALEVARGVLGDIRSKMRDIAIPGNGSSVSLNGAELVTQADNNKQALLEKLRDTLEQSSRKSQLAMKAEEAQSLSQVQSYIPHLSFYIG